MRKAEEEQGARLLHYCKSILLGGVAAFFVCLAFLLLAAVGVSQGFLDPGLQERLTVVGCVLGSFAGGLLAVRSCKGRGLFVGLAVGAVLYLLQLTMGLLLYDTMTLENGGLGLLCGALCGGAAAGILGGGKRSSGGRGGKRRRR